MHIGKRPSEQCELLPVPIVPITALTSGPDQDQRTQHGINDLHIYTLCRPYTFIPHCHIYLFSCHGHKIYVFLIIVELLFVFVDAIFVAPRSEELGIATY